MAISLGKIRHTYRRIPSPPSIKSTRVYLCYVMLCQFRGSGGGCSVQLAACASAPAAGGRVPYLAAGTQTLAGILGGLPLAPYACRRRAADHQELASGQRMGEGRARDGQGAARDGLGWCHGTARGWPGGARSHGLAFGRRCVQAAMGCTVTTAGARARDRQQRAIGSHVSSREQPSADAPSPTCHPGP